MVTSRLRIAIISRRNLWSVEKTRRPKIGEPGPLPPSYDLVGHRRAGYGDLVTPLWAMARGYQKSAASVRWVDRWSPGIGGMAMRTASYSTSPIEGISCRRAGSCEGRAGRLRCHGRF